jgi:uncharacterized RDD family membrane protein YckC
MDRAHHVHRDDSSQVSLDLRVETPENVVLTYQLAGPAARGLAFLLDLMVRMAILFAVGMALGIFGIVLPGLSGGLLLLISFAIKWAYYVVGETYFAGRSVGKWALGLRVIGQQGHPVSLWPSLQRNLLRVVDSDLGLLLIVIGEFSALLNLIPFYGTGLIAVLLSPRFQRVGDLAAGTVVISERHVVLPREPVIVERIDPLPREELGSFVPGAETLSVIDQFLGRRSALTHARGHALASVLARPLAERLHYRGDRRLVEQYPMAFLARVYVTFIRTREEDGDETEGFERRAPRRGATVGAGR